MYTNRSTPLFTGQIIATGQHVLQKIMFTSLHHVVFWIIFEGIGSLIAYGFGVSKVTKGTASNGVQSELVWLPITVNTIWNHSDRLAFSVWDLS